MENMSSKSEQKSITGKEAFRFEQGQEDAITVLTEALLDSGQLGNNAPKVYERLAELLRSMESVFFKTETEKV